jgi:LmbE family N-acetylglucosaminyl deacetylase
MEWYFLSPHFDDVALSCGGLVADLACLAQPGPTPIIFTICAGEPPPGPLTPFAAGIHERWKTGPEAVRQRRLEDELACLRLGARPRYYTLPDCIYRRLNGTEEPLVRSEEDLFMPLPPAEFPVAETLARHLVETLPVDSAVACPITAGGHIDHRLVRRSAEILAERRPDLGMFYYLDFPYILEHPQERAALEESGWSPASGEVSPAGLAAWIAAVSEYRSQISTFWKDSSEMSLEISRFAADGGGRLWHKPA